MNIRADSSPRLIVGEVTDRSARVWGRGKSKHEVMVVKATDESGNSVTETVTLSSKDAYTGVAHLEGLTPSTDYHLEVSYGDRASSVREEVREGGFETAPPDGTDEPFTMMLNSCNFHGWGFFRNNDKVNRRRAELVEDVDLVLHTGDQVYADKAPLSFTLDEFRSAYVKAWSDEGVESVLSERANYMIADDHEIVNGYALDGELTRFQRFLLWARGHHDEARSQYDELVANGKKAYAEFQRSHQPQSHGPDVNYYSFSRGVHQFFAMDTSFDRHRGQERLITPEQTQALFDWLLEHRDAPKFIVTSTPFVMESKNVEDKWNSPEYDHQRQAIIDFLAKEKLSNVVFLAGDVHASGHARMTLEGPGGEEVVIDELVSSPLNGSLLRGADYFLAKNEGTTDAGTSYEVELDEESFVGQGRLPRIHNSNLMKIKVDGEQIEYEIHRTRRRDDGPVRQGSFKM